MSSHESKANPSHSLPDAVRCFSKGRVNSVIVLGQKGTAVIDTQLTLNDAKDLKQEAETLSQGKPILYVVITHEHQDHLAGNQLFQCDIISSHETARSIRAMMTKESARPMEAGLNLTPPSITFGSDLEITLGNLTLEIRRQGGHSPGESAIYIPEIKTLITGDLVFQGSLPFVGTADIPEWISALTELYLLSPDFVIPGHGVPGTKELLIEERITLESLYDYATQAMSQGIGADRAAEEYCRKNDVPEVRRTGFVKAFQRLYTRSS